MFAASAADPSQYGWHAFFVGLNQWMAEQTP
jgi:hypothetical protein